VPSNSFVIAAIAGSGGASAAIDLRTRRVPNWLTYGTAALGIIFAATHVTDRSVAAALGGLALGLLLMLPGHIIGATGAGDVKLFAAVGTLLGPTGIAVAFVYTAIFGGALALTAAMLRGRLNHTLQETATLVVTGGANVAQLERPSSDNRFAYAPAIALGALVAALGF